MPSPLSDRWDVGVRRGSQLLEGKLAFAGRSASFVSPAIVNNSDFFRKTGNQAQESLRQFGSLRPDGGPRSENRSLILIQDTHKNAEAQTNIGRAIQQLISKNEADLIALEGASGPIDLDVFRRFPDQESVHAVADYLLRENKISGPVHVSAPKRGRKWCTGTRLNVKPP